MLIQEILNKNLIPAEEFIFGMADLAGLIPLKFGEYRYGVSIGKRLDGRIIDAIAEGPTLEYYEHYLQTNEDLTEIAQKIRKDLSSAGIDSLVINPTLSTVSEEFREYLPTLTTDLSHKMVATRAGLGWIGKCDLLISKKFGPRVRFVTILVNHRPEKFASPIDKSRCGTCMVCIDRCPAEAANGLLWDIHTHRDRFFDPHKCREKCAELGRQRLQSDRRICGICVSVCPVGKHPN